MMHRQAHLQSLSLRPRVEATHACSINVYQTMYIHPYIYPYIRMYNVQSAPYKTLAPNPLCTKTRFAQLRTSTYPPIYAPNPHSTTPSRPRSTCAQNA